MPGPIVKVVNSAAPKVAHGTDKAAVLALTIPKVYLKLQFRVPGEADPRVFPKGFRVKVLWGEGSDARSGNFIVSDGGLLVFPAKLPKGFMTIRLHPTWLKFTLAWDATVTTESQYIVCEAPGQPKSCEVALGSELAAKAAGGKRYFGLPRDWSLKYADWVQEPANTGNGKYTPATGLFKQDLTDRLQPIGDEAHPIPLTLNPNWRYYRWVFFDRYYGPSKWPGEARGAAHNQRISIPPVSVEGFRTAPRANTDTPDSHSNWTVGNSPDVYQCLPWILQYQDDGAGRKKLPNLVGSAAATGDKMGLRFVTPADTYIYSSSETVRTIKTAPTADELKPGPERLKYYRLPVTWRSYQYYVRGSHLGDGKFFDQLTNADIEAAADQAKALQFCLDDLVLTRPLGVVALGDDERVTLFHHRFSSKAPAGGTVAGLENEGLYEIGAAVDAEGFPYSKKGRAERRNYIWEYPDWIRLVIAQGNLFDAFDERTTLGDVIGAKAAVLRVNATPTGIGVAPGTAAPATVPTQSPAFSVQPFYKQAFPERSNNPDAGPTKHIEFSEPFAHPGTGHEYFNARFDIAHIRCCDHDGTNEIACAFRFIRLAFDFSKTSGKGQPQAFSPPGSSPPGLTRNVDGSAVRSDGWIRAATRNIALRWNGPDAARNQDRAWIVPQTGVPKLRTQVITFPQYLKKDWAHFELAVYDPVKSESSFMQAATGTGQLRYNAVFGNNLAAAHEMGHAGGMPDDYPPDDKLAPRWVGNHLPGNPYDQEEDAADPALMFLNVEIRARYFWHVAEWLRTLNGLDAIDFKVEHGGDEQDYHLPHYAHNRSGRHYVTWPVSFNVRQRSGAETSLYDSFLYMLGKDKYSTQVLPGASAGDPFDAILLILLRTKIDLSAMGWPNGEEWAFAQLWPRVQKLLGPAVAGHTAAFSLMPSPPAGGPEFKKCLLRFLPTWISDRHASEANYTSRNVPHLEVIGKNPPDVPSPPGYIWTDPGMPDAKQLELRIDPNFRTSPPVRPAMLDEWARRVFEHACLTLGLDPASPLSPTGYKNPAAYAQFVRTVQDDTVSPPTMA